MHSPLVVLPLLLSAMEGTKALRSRTSFVLFKENLDFVRIIWFPSFLSRRHVLSIHTKAALGYHVHLCSGTPFIFGDEETVMSHLTKVKEDLSLQFTWKWMSYLLTDEISNRSLSRIQKYYIILWHLIKTLIVHSKGVSGLLWHR